MVGLPELSLQSSHTDTGMRQVKLSRMDWKGTISGGIGDLCVGGRTGVPIPGEWDWGVGSSRGLEGGIGSHSSPFTWCFT